MNYKKHLIKNVNELLVFKDKWEKLEKGYDMTYYQSFSWNVICYECLKKNKLASLTSDVVIYETDSIILPLIIQKVSTRLWGRGKQKGIYFLADNGYSDYLNLIYDKAEEQDVKSLIYIVKAEYKDMDFFLNNVIDESILTRINFQNIKIFEELCVYIPICSDLNIYNSFLSKHTRQNIRTAQNRLNRDKKLFQMDILKGILDDDLIMKLKAIHLERMKIINTYDTRKFGGKIINAFKNKNLERKEYKNNVIERAMRKESKSFTLIVKIDSVVVGYLYGFDEGNIIRISQNCFKKEWGFYSPLFLGSYKLICDLITQGLYDKVDFTKGTEDYKYKLGGKEQKIYLYRI